MYGKQVWVGREVEGRYSDLMTIFFRGLPLRKELDELLGSDEFNLSEYPHYYFTIEYMRKIADEDKIEFIRSILDKSNSAVTIEAMDDTLKSLPPDLVNRCHIIYRIHDDALQLLKQTDTLSIDAGWYRVHQVTKCHMMEIKPDDYKHDLEV